jgi:hypothetical protein
LELFKPFIINKLIERELAYNVRSNENGGRWIGRGLWHFDEILRITMCY